MSRWILGAVFAIGLAIGTMSGSYIVMRSLYGTTTREVYVQIENQLERVVPMTVDNAEQSNSYILTYANGQYSGLLDWDNVNWYSNVYLQRSNSAKYQNSQVLNTQTTQMSSLYADNYLKLEKENYVLTVGTFYDWAQADLPMLPATENSIDITEWAYDNVAFQPGPASSTIENIAANSFLVQETRPPDVLPIASGIGITTGIIAFAAVWIGYRQSWGEATSTLLEQGLHDMTVRDIEIVGYIMQKREFTIPELMKLTNASKLTIWRTVQKLVEQGLVKLTDETKPAANGLGGRGKPSQIYKYIGEKGKPKPQETLAASSEPK
ncbi:MAG: hypothetical protein AB1305_03255 [Candidatus Hadarchaeota archaeon]